MPLFHRAVASAAACVSSVVILSSSAAIAAPGSITVEVNQPGVKISPSLYGIFFEEINYAGDGGLYAEMLRNRNFEEDAERLEHWTFVQSGTGTQGRAELVKKEANARQLDGIDMGNIKPPYNAHAVRITASDIADGGRVGIANDGYWV